MFSLDLEILKLILKLSKYIPMLEEKAMSIYG